MFIYGPKETGRSAGGTARTQAGTTLHMPYLPVRVLLVVRGDSGL